MATGQISALHSIHQFVVGQTLRPLPDQELLNRFVSNQDRDAFETLVQRHGPLVLRVCRRVLGDYHLAEDACQATFLVLARKAAGVAKRELLANWLYGIAQRTARKANAQAQRHRRGDLRSITSTAPSTSPAAEPSVAATTQELCELLDRELRRLPDECRAPLLLCYWEGRTRDQVARHLGWTLRTLERRLEQGRALLHARLARQGVTLSPALLITEFAGHAAPAALPAKAVAAIATAALRFGAREGAAGGSIAALANAVLSGMAVAKCQTLATVVLVAAGVFAGAGWLAIQSGLTDQAMTAPTKSASAPLVPANKNLQKENRTDQLGDPLPSGALTRLGTVRMRHSGPVNCSVFTPDGKSIITASSDCTLRQWDILTGKEIRRFVGHESAIHQLALSPDGKLLASAEGQLGRDLEVTIRLWEVASAKELDQVKGLPARLEGLAWCGDNKTLAARCRDGTVHTVNIANGQARKQYDLHAVRTTGANYYSYGSVAFSPDGKILASCAGQDGVHIVDLAKPGKPLVLRGKEKAFHFVAFTPDGKTLVSGGDLDIGDNGTGMTWPLVNSIALWDVARGKRLSEFTVGDITSFRGSGSDALILSTFRREAPSTPTATSWALSDDGKTIALGYWDRSIHLFDLASGKPLRRLTGRTSMASAAFYLTFSKDGKMLAAADCFHGPSHHSVCVLDTTNGKQISQFAPGYDTYVRAVAVSPDEKSLATLGIDQVLILWQESTAKPLQFLRHQRDEKKNPNQPMNRFGHGFETIAYSPDGKSIAAGAHDGTVCLFDAVLGKELWRQTWPGVNQTPHITGLAFSPNGKTLAVAGDHPGFLSVCDTATGKVLADFDVTTNRIKNSVIMTSFGSTLMFSSDGTTLIADGGDSTIRRWRVANGDELGRVGLDNWKERFHAAFSPDGRLAAATATNTSLVIWNMELGQKILSLEMKAGLAHHLAFSPDGRYLAVSGTELAGLRKQNVESKAIELLEVASGKWVHRQPLPPQINVWSAAFSKDGKRFLTGHSDTTAVIWNVDPLPLAKGVGQLDDQWNILGGDDAAAAWQAKATLSATPGPTVQFLKAKLQPKEVDRKLILKLIADLDSDKFAMREEAANKLKQFGPEVHFIISEVLAGNPSLEVRMRLAVIQSSVQNQPTQETLRTIRAVAVLERIGSADARNLLSTLAKGAPKARLTQEAAAALDRLGR